MNRTIPSDHAAVRLVIQKPTNRGHQNKRILAECPNIPISAPFRNGFTITTDFLPIRLVHLAEFKVLEKVRKLTIRELSRKTPDSMGAKLLIASTASRG